MRNESNTLRKTTFHTCAFITPDGPGWGGWGEKSDLYDIYRSHLHSNDRNRD